ncbi:EF-P beta-lysylation protein EpmB [Salinisphaera sp. T31B1]|uniref:EF-P beta-lysylation protein EpmB n=1 Tax=Salinisphaera sp. T31B1 TaxID=727963 RepID=UPI00334224F0
MSALARKRVSLSQSDRPWQQAMRDAITDVDTLFELLELPRKALPGARRAARLFDLRVPRGYVARMARGDLADPLLRQVLPLDAEHDDTPGFVFDAVGDGDSHVGHGLLHKYTSRALLVTTGACAIHCRYCFRRHFDYAAHQARRGPAGTALAPIAADDRIDEVILSGGDPLSLSNARLAAIGAGIDEIKHVKRLRIHSRTAVVLPERIDDGFVDWIAGRAQRTVIVIHANHARELDDAVAAALARLRDAGATLLNQAVLLRGVNDDVETLAALSQRLFALGVLPYYLHLLDRVAGTAHFEVGPAQAQTLIDRLAARLPGYLVPRLARESAGEGAKQVLGHRARNHSH